jgi:Flp pilus assembly protein TadG
MSWLVGHRRNRGERGAVAIMVALSMTVLLVSAAFVLDLGLARTDKLTNRTYTDAAAASGIRSLDTGDGIAKPFRAACAALSYLEVSDPSNLGSLVSSWMTGDGAALADPCGAGSALLDAPCVPNTLSSWAWYHGTAATSSGKVLTIDIKTGYTTPDPAFDAIGSGDNGLPAQGGCDQLAVIMQENTKPGLGKIASSSDLVTRVRTVARMTASSGGDASAALLILERTDCPAISVNSVNTFIQVLGFGDKPGVIHSDSLGNGPNCVINKVMVGKFADPPGISAHQSETGDPRLPGMITTVAGSGAAGAVPANATDGASKVCAETALPVVPPKVPPFPPDPPTSCGAAAGRALVGRGPVDRRYNNSLIGGVRPAMSTASSQYNLSPAAAVIAGYTVLPGGCNNIAGTSALVKVYVNCPSGATFKTFTFTNATTIVFNGDLKLSSTNTLSMRNVTRLYVKGSTATNGGISSQGTLTVNLGSSSDCSTRTAAASAQIVVGTGSFTGGAQSTFHICQTTVLMANEQTSLSCPVPTPPVAGVGTAPYDNTCNGYADVNAGGAMDWTAPDHVSSGATQSDWDNLEDLALWTEASHVSSIGGGASMNITGVFFLPNANPFIISGHGNQTIAANAQFVARKLQVKGQGTLYMRPDPNDSFTLPVVSTTFSLVR